MEPATNPQDEVLLYHNPRCSKSRQVFSLLRARGIEPHVIEYLKTPLDATQLRELLDMLGMQASQLLRRNEPAYKQEGLDAKGTSEARIFAALCSEAVLIQRPIVVVGHRAIIGRPPERVLSIL